MRRRAARRRRSIAGVSASGAAATIVAHARASNSSCIGAIILSPNSRRAGWHNRRVKKARGVSPRWMLPLLLVIGAALRFWRLGEKPVWLDEAMTMLIAAGRGPGDVPTNVAVPLAGVAH